MAKSTNYRAPVRAHRDIIDRDGGCPLGGSPALPVPPARFVPVIRHEPMRRSTRRERMEEIAQRFRPFLHPWNVPTAEMTAEEKRRYGR